MTTNENSEVFVAEVEEEQAIEGDFASFLAGGKEEITEVSKAIPATTLEKRMATVDKAKEIAVQDPRQAHFRFRELLTDKQLSDLQAGAPAVAKSFVEDVNKILTFGQGTIDELKKTSKQMLEAQKSVNLPEADEIMNDLLRALDGFQKKNRNLKFDDFGKKILGIFKSAKYSVTTLTREMKPIEEKLDMAEVKLEQMDNELADNVARGQILHRQTLNQMNDVVRVLASLEEIIDNIRADYEEVDGILQDAQAKGLEHVEYNGEMVSTSALEEIRARYSMALSETEKSWHNWRQQFFLGWANAPATRNLVVSTFAFRRQLRTFKEMGIQQGRQALVTWKQAAEVRAAAEKSQKLHEGVQQLIQSGYNEVADTTKLIAEASQAPMVSEETILSVIDSVKRQARSIVEADRQGRALRARNVQALERGEVQIKDEVLAMENQLADIAREDHTLDAGSSRSSQRALQSGSPDDLLGTLGNS